MSKILNNMPKIVQRTIKQKIEVIFFLSYMIYYSPIYPLNPKTWTKKNINIYDPLKMYKKRNDIFFEIKKE